MRWPLRFALGLCLVWLASPLLADDSKDEGKKVPLSDLPKAVSQAADRAGERARLQHVQWKQACLRHEPGRQVFDIEGTDHDGRQVKVTVSDSGQILTLGREVPESEVPKTVLETLKAQLKGFHCETITSLYDKDGSIHSFEFDGKQDDKPRRAVIDTSGQLLDASKEHPSKK